MYSLAYFVRDHTAKLFGSCGRDQHGVQTLKMDAWQKCSLQIRACGGEVRPASKCRKEMARSLLPRQKVQSCPGWAQCYRYGTNFDFQSINWSFKTISAIVL